MRVEILLRCARYGTAAMLLSGLALAGCANRESTAPAPTPASRLVAVRSPTGVVISQVYGGGGNQGATFTHDFIELYNAGTGGVSLNGWSIQYASAAGATWTRTNLTGTISAGGFFLVQMASGTGGTTPLPTPDLVGTTAMSGTAGKLALSRSATTLTGICPLGGDVTDFVGYGGANCAETNPTPVLSNATAAVRKGAGTIDTDDNSADFTVAAPTPRNGVSGPPVVVSTIPSASAVNAPTAGNLTVTFSRPVTATGSWLDLSCTNSGAHPVVVTGGTTTFTIDPTTDFAASETCIGKVIAANIAALSDAALTMAADYTWSFTTASADPCTTSITAAYVIQGAGAASLIVGQTVTTRGVVVGDYEGPAPALRGFYLQDAAGDGLATTSDAIFVFDGSNVDRVKAGEVVAVTGTVGESQGQTQVSASAVTVCGTGTVTPTDIAFPVETLTALEQVEGMLVRVPQAMTVTETFQLGRFGEVVVAANGRLQQPTNVTTPGAAALALQAANDLRRLIVDDASQAQHVDPIVFARGGNPLSASNTLRGGDEIAGLTGVLTYTWAGNAASGNAYRLRPINALGVTVPNFIAMNTRTSSAPDVGGTLRVGALNLLNYFNTFAGCTGGVAGATTECRGADNSTEFERQSTKTIAALLGMNADIVGIVEVENDGYGPTSAIAELVSRLNAATAPGTYAFIDSDAATGQVNSLGNDAIKVGLLYKPSKVTPTGTTAVLNTAAFVNGGTASPLQRPAIAQAFMQPNRARVVISVNHFKSKGSGSGCVDPGDGQGNCNAVRVIAAQQLAAWLAADPTQTGDTDVLVLGDLNAYAREAPITTLLSAGFTNLIEQFNGASAYSYGFGGQWGYLDHALASTSLRAQVTGATEWHINADEPSVLDYNTEFKTPTLLASLFAPDPYRVSDHDPIIVGLNLTALRPNRSNLPTPAPGPGALARP